MSYDFKHNILILQICRKDYVLYIYQFNLIFIIVNQQPFSCLGKNIHKYGEQFLSKKIED